MLCERVIVVKNFVSVIVLFGECCTMESLDCSHPPQRAQLQSLTAANNDLHSKLYCLLGALVVLGVCFLLQALFWLSVCLDQLWESLEVRGAERVLPSALTSDCALLLSVWG